MRSKTTRAKAGRRKLLGRVRKAGARPRKRRAFLAVGDRVRVIEPSDAYSGHTGEVIAKTPRWIVVNIDGDKCDFKANELTKI